MALSAIVWRNPAAFEEVHKRKYSGLKSPYDVGISQFHRLAMDESTLRFSFVRNPYDRLVSTWADKFQNKPLVPGNSFIDKYLERRETVNPSFPAGRDRSLSFAEFAHFAASTADKRVDAHWQLQDDLLNFPGITLDFIGKVESFSEDFARVMDHARVSRQLREVIGARINMSQHLPWQDYYTSALADRVYRAYERDFDRLRYPRTVSI